jgi:protein tyrosine/serine phosphatase
MKLWILTLLAALCVAGCSGAPRGFPAVGGIANLDQVNEHLYRGAQPNRLGLQYLHKLGIGTIINLRMADDAWSEEEAEAKALGMKYYNVPMNSFRHMNMENVTNALALIEQSRLPVFVHCKVGCDRTGTVIACYRIQHDGWDSARALGEAKTYGMNRREIFMKLLVKRFAKSAIQKTAAVHGQGGAAAR